MAGELCAKTYDKVLLVGSTRTYKTIQAAVNACQSSQRCEIKVDAGTYAEQVSISTKSNMWLHGADTTNLPIIKYLDTLSTQPKDNVNGDGSDSWGLYSERNGVVQVLGSSDSVRLSHLKIDAVRHFSFQWENVWGSRWQFSGNSGVAITNARAVQIDHCDIYNSWWGIHFKDRNTGGVYANLDLWEIEQLVGTATPFSRFGQTGGHLFEKNRIHDNVWAFYAEQTWDLPATIRFNLVWNNAVNSAKDYVCANKTICGVPDASGGDKQYHAGGFFFQKDAMLVSHLLHNNTLYGNPQTIAGYYKAGKNHLFYNNLVDQQTTHIENYPSQAQYTNIIYGYTNAHNNVVSDNGKAVFPLFGTSDPLWKASNLVNAGTAPVDSFLSPVGHDNFWYKTPEFQSVTATSANFLCPDWSKANVTRTIAGKGWSKAGSRGTTSVSGVYTAEQSDVGALWQNGSGCQWGGVQDSVGINLRVVSPMLFYNQTDARFQFELTPISAQDSDFTEVSYFYTGYVDSIPFPSNLGNMPLERSPVVGLSGLLQFGLNDETFAFPRSSLGEYGMLRFSVKAKHKNGKTYTSNLEIVEYRRLKYTLAIDLYNKAGVKVDTVAKGDTVRVQVTVLDITMSNLSTGIVLNTRKNFLNDSKASWPQNFANPFIGSGSAKFVVSSYEAMNEMLTIGGIIGELQGANDTLKYFITGTKPFFILPSNASQLVITNQALTAPQGEPLNITVSVKDVFGDLTDEPVDIRLTSAQDSLVGPVPQVVRNNDGTLTFIVTPNGSIGKTFTLVASVDGKSITSAPVTFTITPPTNRKVIIVNKPSESYHYSTGEVVPLTLRLVDSKGDLVKNPDWFGLTIRDGNGDATDIPYLYYDSTSATATDLGNNNLGNFTLMLPTTGEMTVYIKWPITTDSSDIYVIQTQNTDFSNPILHDEAKINVDVPYLVFVDQTGKVYTTPPPIDTVTGYLMPLSVQARINGIICTQCNDIVFTDPSSEYIHFKQTSNGPDVSQITLKNGESDFYVYAVRQVLAAEFTMYARDSASTVTYDSLDFRKPPVPQADSAAVFDTNGDGIADSLALWYGESVADSLPDTLVFAWPSTGNLVRLAPSAANLDPNNDSVLVILGDLTDAILTDGTGKMLSIYQDAEGQWWNQRLDIKDRMGPVLKRVALVQAWTGPQDTLFVTFSEPLDTSAIEGGAFILNGLGAVPVGAKGIQIDDTTWIFMVNKNQISEGDSLNLNFNGPLFDAMGNSPSRKNQGQLVSLIRRPIPASQKGNLFEDRDADGTLDHITVSLLGPVDQDYLNDVLDSIVFTWMDSLGKAIQIKVPGSKFTIDPTDPKKLHYQIPNPEKFFPYLTSIDVDRFGAYGTATMYATLEGEKQNSLPVKMTDGMAPVIREASLKVSDRSGGDDVLTVTFSEAVTVGTGMSEANMFDIKSQSSSTSRILDWSKIKWVDDHTVELTFGNDIRYDQRPSSQDSIRIHEGALQDLAGVAVPSDVDYVQDNPGQSGRPYKMVVGDFRFKISTVTKSTYNPSDPYLQNAAPVETKVRPFGTTVNAKKDLGMVVDFGSIDLLHTVQRAVKDKLYSRDSTMLIEDIEIDQTQIKMKVEIQLFSNLGGFVAEHHETIACDDARFEGDCIQNPEQVYLQWNFKSATGRMVGTGAYFAQMNLKVWYDGKTSGGKAASVSITTRSKLEAWGIIRNVKGSNLRD
jgi:hypothetical protein